jgi:hypothetical protein
MAQFETTGGGVIDSGDRRVTRKVVVSTDPTVQAPGGEGVLTNASVTQEPGGIRRGVFEYTVAGSGDASYNQYGKRVELAGGTREVPIISHAKFKAMTIEEISKVQKAVDDRETSPLTSPTPEQELLYSFLSRGVEYFLAPAVVGRVSEIESALPSLDPIAKVANPSELNAPTNTFWVCTAITATPIGDQYEVTREYTLNFSSWDEVEQLYDWS